MKKYQLVRKAFWVGHKDSINNTEDNCHPEQIECEVIYVDVKDGANKARREFYSRSYHLLPSGSKYIDIRARRRKSEDAYLYEGQPRCMNHIHRIEARKEWRARMEKLVADHPKAKVRIHSGQWGQYWGVDGCGYTNNPDHVGIYEIEDAWNRVSHCGIEKRIEFEFAK
jgi:hypothetical protein